MYVVSRHHVCCNLLRVLPSPDSLLAAQQANELGGDEARNNYLFGKPVHWKDGRLVSPKNHLIRIEMPLFFNKTERERCWGIKVKKRPFILQNRKGYMLISSFLHPFTDRKVQLVPLQPEQSPSGRGASQVARVVKNLPANGRGIRCKGSIRGSERSPREGHGAHSSYSCLENPMGREPG